MTVRRGKASTLKEILRNYFNGMSYIECVIDLCKKRKKKKKEKK